MKLFFAYKFFWNLFQLMNHGIKNIFLEWPILFYHINIGFANPLFSKDSIKEASLAPYYVIALKNIFKLFLLYNIDNNMY